MSIRSSLFWLAAAATVLLSVSAASASNSRNAPTIDNFSAVDIADLYLFRDPSGCQHVQPRMSGWFKGDVPLAAIAHQLILDEWCRMKKGEHAPIPTDLNML
jgi:hypothetical protein